ncbi:HNH endonuclease [Paenibacillus sp. FSL L8-0323]|uniref:HNH endonuclease n=1 Tax=Paenibacillus sp. FSL L8-0323 TaxID=2975330 RepID=UPI0030F97283
MIKIERIECPKELTAEIKNELTAEFKKDSKTNVWNLEYIKDALFDMSNGKCVFCECKLGEESKYMEVEHFHPKSLYPDEVIEWENLLPICKRCNGKKLNHDTKAHPIVNPTVNIPKDHIKLNNYRFIGIDELGKETIAVLALNDQKRLLLPRVFIGNQISEILEDLTERTKELRCFREISTRQKNNIIGRVEKLLDSCQPCAEYSATCSYSLFGDDNYCEVVQFLKDFNFWSQELENLEVSAKNNLMNKAKNINRLVAKEA